MPKAARFCCASVAVLVISTAFGAHAAAARTSATRSANDPFACFALQCGVPSHGAFPHFVVGRVAAIADAEQSKGLFNGMRKRGNWATLPVSAETFWENLQPVAIDAGQDTTIVTLISQEEAQAVPLHVGDFVRYSPHRGKYEVPPADKVAAEYWGVDGCVEILCRAADHACFKHYVSGVYRASDGTQLSLRSFEPVDRGVVIDTGTMFPRRAAE